LQTGITTYSETGALIGDYLEEWNTEIIKKQYSNLLYGKKIQLAFTPDEEYTNATMLTDGAVGFSDYYNSWMICTQEALSVNIIAQNVKEAKTLEMDFLQDSRHNIFPPEKVEITIGQRKYEATVIWSDDKKVSKKHVSIPFEVKQGDKTIHIQTIKSPDYKNKAIACDEIFVKK
jgi:hypothetical protein